MDAILLALCALAITGWVAYFRLKRSNRINAYLEHEIIGYRRQIDSLAGQLAYQFRRQADDSVTKHPLAEAVAVRLRTVHDGRRGKVYALEIMVDPSRYSRSIYRAAADERSGRVHDIAELIRDVSKEASNKITMAILKQLDEDYPGFASPVNPMWLKRPQSSHHQPS